MSKKSRFRGTLDKKHGKPTETLLQCERQQLYHIYWLLRTQLCRKKSRLVICKILKLLTHWLPMTSILVLIETI